MADEAGERAPYRVVQWTTGNVGRRSVLAIVANPGARARRLLRVVGRTRSASTSVSCAAPAPTGVVATDDVDALLASAARLRRLQPEVARRRRARPHPRSGHQRRDDRRVHHRCTRSATGRRRVRRRVRARRQSSIFGSGMNPGFANLLGIVSAGICDRIDSITILESVDSTGYDSPETELPGRLRPPDRRPGAARDDAARAPRCSATRCA